MPHSFAGSRDISRDMVLGPFNQLLPFKIPLFWFNTVYIATALLYHLPVTGWNICSLRVQYVRAQRHQWCTQAAPQRGTWLIQWHAVTIWHVCPQFGVMLLSAELSRSNRYSWKEGKVFSFSVSNWGCLPDNRWTDCREFPLVRDYLWSFHRYLTSSSTKVSQSSLESSL